MNGGPPTQPLGINDPVIVVGATCAVYKTDGTETNWLTNAEQMVAAHPGVVFFAALETLPWRDSRYEKLRARLAELPHETWSFSLDDGEPQITSVNRLTRICMGRNLVTEYALRRGATHVLFLDTDLVVPGDSIEKLMEVGSPIVGGDVPHYCLSGPLVPGDLPLQRHWNTAGFLLVRNDVLWRVKWRHEHFHEGGGLTDDPCYANDVEAAGFGPTLVRKDVIGVHAPLVPVEDRGHDLRLKLRLG